MKLASATFVLLLVGAHVAGDPGQLLGLPLSQLRDDEQWWLGYLLFAALLLISLLYTAAMARAGKEGEALAGWLAAVLLLIVALTPSLDWVHVACSAVLLLLLYGQYVWLLRESASPWLIPHALAPLALVFVCNCHSYGLWQKGMILYMVALANIRHFLLGRVGAGGPRPAGGPRLFDDAGVKGRRRVYRLEPGRVRERCKAR